jgi:hypothetical protein
MTLKNAINGFRIKDRYDQAFIEQGISTSEYYVFGTTKCSVMNLFKQLFKRVIMWLFKQNIFKLRRIIEEVITYFCDVFYSSHRMYALLLLQNLDTVLPFSTSSVILVTDNVTKAAQVGIQMELTKQDGNVVSQFQACSVLSIVLNSFTGGCLYFTTSGPAQASITVQTSIDNGATWTNNTGSFTSPRCDIHYCYY